MNTTIKYNDGNKLIYCIYCKLIIQQEKKYALVKDEYDDFEKTYHLECLPAEEE